jgi:glycosyltransferase involved in cell wall biosynthesis
MPLVLIIIVNWNGKKWLTGCLSSLNKQTFRNFEIIIVDNGSTDNSAAFVRKN